MDDTHHRGESARRKDGVLLAKNEEIVVFISSSKNGLHSTMSLSENKLNIGSLHNVQTASFKTSSDLYP